ncbi:MAG: extracellular solute-binding protein [Proteobacteria bacterium]|nr:extracellular solute-binding protein [Pseudomonadota bacterium]
MIRILGAAIASVLISVSPVSAQTSVSHGIAMHGDLKYPADFKHFDYVNPDAPKGGELRNWGFGGFDTFNPFVIKGRAAGGIGLLFESLMVPSAAEPFSKYGLLAESVEMPEDRSWISFILRTDAKWHDGKPVTVDDVIWSFETLKEKGQPLYRYYYANVETPVKTGERTVKFTFTGGVNRELPLIVSDAPVLPKHYWEGRDFEATTLEPPLGSGPYRILSFEPDREVVYERVKDYWGADHPTQKGQWNFDRVRFDYYRDSTVAIEALKSGAFDYRLENSAKDWATAYDVPAVRDGRLIKSTFEHNRPAGMQGFVMNQRRDMFKDPNVRQALSYAFDFEWSNKALFYGQYVRTRSYFDNSELSATGLPEGEVLKILEPYRGRIPEEVFTTVFNPPKTDGTGNIRGNLRDALKLLEEAGWTVDPNTKKLTNTATGRPMTFEILLVSPLFERIALPYTANLKRLGIEASVRTVDTSQYKERLDRFDFDMVVLSIGQSASPGNEQREFWGAAAADRDGSRNIAGIKNPVVDELIEKVISAGDRKELVNAVRALDYVLQWQHLVVPHWHIPYDRYVYWDRFGRPDTIPDSGVQIFSWWVDPAKDAALSQLRRYRNP